MNRKDNQHKIILVYTENKTNIEKSIENHTMREQKSQIDK